MNLEGEQQLFWSIFGVNAEMFSGNDWLELLRLLGNYSAKWYKNNWPLCPNNSIDELKLEILYDCNRNAICTHKDKDIDRMEFIKDVRAIFVK